MEERELVSEDQVEENQSESKKDGKQQPKKPEKAKKAERSIPDLAKKKPVVKASSGITLAQFLRSEDLGFSKDGFANWIRKKGIGGRKPRTEWYALFQTYRSSPVPSFKQS